MAIEMLTGTTGGGKSYHAVNHIIPAIIKEGRPVVTNLPLKMDWWQENYPEEYRLLSVVDKTAVPHAKVDQGKKIADYESGEELPAFYGDVCLTDFQSGNRPYLIIDEAAGLWSKARTTDEHRDFIDHHRHFELDILLIVQDERKLDAAIRYNVEMVYKVVNLQQQGKKGVGQRYVLKTWEGNTANTAKKPDIEPSTLKFEPKGYEAYQSRMFGGNVANKDSISARNVWLDWRFFMLGGMFAFVLVMIFVFDGLRLFIDPASMVGSPTKSTDIRHEAANRSDIRSARSRSGLVFAGSVEKKGETLFLVSMNGKAARRIQPGHLKRLGLELRPASGCAASWLLSFTYSMDDLVIASFTSGPGSSTLPMVLYSSIRLGVSPEINALSTILISIVAIGVFTAALVDRRRNLRLKLSEDGKATHV